MKYLLSFDCGKSSGVTLWSYSDQEPATRIGAWQFGGGAAGLRDWIEEHYSNDFWDYYNDEECDPTWAFLDMNLYIDDEAVSLVCEKFTPLQGKGFSLTMDAVEPLVCEGVLIGLHVIPAYEQKTEQDCYQRPASMYFCGGSTKAEKLKRSRAWLKENGLLLTGKDVGCPDADDAISSTLHALAWFRKKKHYSSLVHYWGEQI